MNTHKLLLTIPFALALSACGGSDNPSTTSTISAAEGGTLEISESNTTVSFPPGAVAEDTQITLELGAVGDFAALEDARSEVLVFDPEMVLDSPAQLSVDLSDVDPSSSVYVMQFLDGVWLRPELSAVSLGSGGIGSAPVTILAPTAIVVESVTISSSRITGRVAHLYTEEPLSGISFDLWTSTEEMVASTTSGSDGSFAFENVVPGTYIVLANVSAEDNCFGDPTEKSVVLTDDAPAEVSFGFVPGPCE